MIIVDGILYCLFFFPPSEVSSCSYLRVKLLFSGCSVHEKGCRCPNPKLPKSSVEATLSPSQCHLTCKIANLSGLHV